MPDPFDFNLAHPSSYRDRWVVSVRISKLRERAEKLVEYHTARVAHWSEQVDTAYAEYRASIQTVEHDVTGGVSMGVKADPEAAQHWQNCKAKLSHHRGRAREFELWVDFFGESPLDSTIEATVSDLRAFAMPADVEADD